MVFRTVARIRPPLTTGFALKGGFVKKVTVVLLLAAVACSSSAPSSAQSKPKAPPPVANPTPTPGPMSRIDPTVVEETETYVIRALPKDKFKKVGDHSIKDPLLTKPMEYFKEDDKYYYVYFPKSLPEEIAARQAQPAVVPTPGSPGQAVSAKDVSPGVSMADFTDITPPRVPGSIRLEKVANPGLPVEGMWRASFVMADVNGDGIPDIVAPPSRVGNGQLRVWIGDGHGSFKLWPLTFTQPDGKPLSQFSVDYGAVAVGDIDGDGKMDIVSASHSGGLVSLFGDGKGTFRVVRAGLPGRDFSSQAIALLDVNGDGKLDIVASKDVPSGETMNTIDKTQVRVYEYLGDQGWEWKKQGLVGGFYSNSLHGWDYDGSGRKAILTGSNYTGALTLLWHNAGNGTFQPVEFGQIELYAYHFTTQPGTFGKARVPAFADAFFSQANLPNPTRAVGISIYEYDQGKWIRHRAWRKLESKAAVTAMAFGDLDGDGLDDIVFADNEQRKLRILFQQPDGSFSEMDEKEEPSISSLGQWICLADLNGDGRLDIVLSRTVSSSAPNEKGGFDVYLNKGK
jgi:hypothetical protein